MTSTTEVVEETTTKFNVGDRVQVVDHHSMGGTAGTVTKVRNEPDREPVYTIRTVEPDRNYDRFGEGDLEPDESGFLDLDELGQLVAEIRAVVSDTRYPELGLSSPDRSTRIRELARVGFLASRAVWLETCDQDREEHARQVIDRKVDSGELIRLPGGHMVKADHS